MSVLYFAYGSNLYIEQMIRRCPSAQVVGQAALDDHHLTFFGVSQVWDRGGVADAEYRPRARLHGAVYELDPADFEALDRFEDRYDRARRKVVAASGVLECYTYHRKPNQTLNPPSARYLATIAYGYRQHGLPLETLLAAL